MKARLRKYIWVLVLIIAGLLISTAISFEVYRSKADKERELFLRGAEEQGAIVEGVLKSSFDILNAVRAFYSASEFVDAGEFSLFTRGYLDKDPSLVFIGWMPLDPNDRGRVWLEYMESAGRSDVLANVGGLSWPLLEEIPSSEPRIIDEKIFPAQSEEQVSLFRSVQAKDGALKGYIIALIDLDLLKQEALRNEQTHNLELEIIKRAPKQGIYTQEGVIYADIPLEIGGKVWTARVHSTRSSSIYDHWDIIVMMLAVIMFVIFAFNYSLNQLKREEQIEEEVSKRTTELKEKNDLLKESIEYQQRAEMLIKRRVLESQLIYETTSAASEADSFEGALGNCLSRICGIMSWPLGHIYLVDETRQELLPSSIWYDRDKEAHASFVELTMRSIFVTGQGLPGRVLETRGPVWIEDVTKSDNFPRAKALTDSPIRGAFAFPVIVSGKVVAVIEVFHHQPMQIQEDFLKTIKTMGEQISHVLENKKGQKELKQEKERLEIFQSVAVNREMEMIELKRENNELHRQLGRVPPHDLSFLRNQGGSI